MNEWIKKNFNLVLIIFILLGPILDMVTGIILHVFHVNITIGIIFRILFLIFVLYALIFVYKKKKHLYLYGILILYGIFYIVGMLLYKDGVGIFSEIQGLARVFYFPVLLIALYDLRDEIKVTNMTLMVILLTYLVCILVPNCLNIGFESYEITKKGSLGFFNSANEISGIISILTPADRRHHQYGQRGQPAGRRPENARHVRGSTVQYRQRRCLQHNQPAFI